MDWRRLEALGVMVCRWCHGRGCLVCESTGLDIQAAPDELPEPIISFRTDDPVQMAEAREVIGMDALRHAFGPDGRGCAEIEERAAAVRARRAGREG